LIDLEAVVNNRTICDQFGVANMGGIRVNNSRNLIVLICNNTDATYRNEWRDDGTLHFVGMGAKGLQKLDRQNRTLADSARRGYAVYLFEVFERGRYVYAGEVELAGEPYMSDQPDARAEDRFVWIFPLRKKEPSLVHEPKPPTPTTDYLPHGAYAVIGADLTDEQHALVIEAVDKLKVAGVQVFDKRDRDYRRYEEGLTAWHQAVLDRVRARINELIANRKRAAKAANREFGLVDGELKVNSASTEADLRVALRFLDYDDPIAQEQVFEEARTAVPMPDPPESIPTSDPVEPVTWRRSVEIDPSKFDGIT
jgi:hypothetical protein